MYRQNRQFSSVVAATIRKSIAASDRKLLLLQASFSTIAIPQGQSPLAQSTGTSTGTFSFAFDRRHQPPSISPSFRSYTDSIKNKFTSAPNSKVVANNNIKSIFEKHLFHGASINIGGFGLGGIPETLIHELEGYDAAKDLTIASLTAGVDGFGLGKLFEVEGKVKRVLASYVGENKVSRITRCVAVIIDDFLYRLHSHYTNLSDDLSSLS